MRFWLLFKKMFKIDPSNRENRRVTSLCLGDDISQDFAVECLRDFLIKKCLPKLQRIPASRAMTDNQRGALLVFAYNLGPNFYHKL
jgi:hypothetical protein